MKGSLRIGSVAGIGIFLHWTFFLLFPALIIFRREQGASAFDNFNMTLLLLAVFGCVVLHELGHALTARRFGIKTRDITLLPIGGVARLENMPDKPSEELWVALAGPAVNVVIATLIFVFLLITAPQLDLSNVGRWVHYFLPQLMAINIALVIFNMLPAFPMDGGRVLRALLAYKLDYAKATRYAAYVGQAMAIFFGLVGILYGQWMLLFIALFVYLGAEQEAESAYVRSALKGKEVRLAMMTRFISLTETDTLAKAVEEMLAGSQHDFPVVRGKELVGMLSLGDLVRGLSEQGRHAPVGQAMDSDTVAVEPDYLLSDILPQLRGSGSNSVAVVENGQIIGLLTPDNVNEWLMVRAALENEPTVQSPASAS